MARGRSDVSAVEHWQAVREAIRLAADFSRRRVVEAVIKR